MDQEIIRKVQALLALAKSTNCVHEAQAALRTATKIVETHRLNMAEIEAGTGRAETACEDSEPLFTGGKIFAWQNNIVGGLADAHGCCPFSVTSWGKGRYRKSIFLFGRPTDTAVVRALWIYVTLALDRAWKRETSRHNKNSWWFGAADGVCMALQDGKKEARTTATTSAIVLVDQRLTDAREALVQARPSIKDPRTHKVQVDRDVYNRGRRVGRQVMESHGRTPLEPGHRTAQSETGQLGLDLGSAYTAARRS